MDKIVLSKKELKCLHEINEFGSEAVISVYQPSQTKKSIEHGELLKGCVIKSFSRNTVINDFLTADEYQQYIENKHQKTLAYSMMDSSNFKIFNIPLGPIYLNKDFFGFYQAHLKNATSLQSKCYNTHSIDYLNLEAFTNYISQINDGLIFELHPNDIYTDDFHLSNILVDKDNQIHFIDADGFRVGDINETYYYLSHYIKDDDLYYAHLKNNPKYLKNGILRANRDRDIYYTYAHFIELITKKQIDHISKANLYQLLERANFPNEFIDDFSKCLRSDCENTFIQQDTLDKIRTDYKMCLVPFSKGNYNVEPDCRLVKKR